jgi:hypothetical protein
VNVVAFAACHVLRFVLFQIAGDFGGAQKLVDALRLVERVVGPEYQIGDIFQLDPPRKFAAQETVMAVQGARDIVAVLAAERARKDNRMFQIGADPHLGDGDDFAYKLAVLNVLGSENLRKRMAKKLTRAKLPLRRAFRGLVFHGAFSETAIIKPIVRRNKRKGYDAFRPIQPGSSSSFVSMPLTLARLPEPSSFPTWEENALRS